MRIGIAILLAGFMLSGTSGCKDKSMASAGASKPVTLTLDWRPEPEFGGFYAAQLGGAFARHGLNVKIENAGGATPMWQLVATGQTDFATTAADQVLIARARGADVVALFAVYQTSPQGIMVHKARGFRSIGDVFTNTGSLAAENNTWLQFCLEKYQPVKVNVSAFSGGIAGFFARRDYSQQCFVTSEPILARAQGADPQTFLIADAGFNPYTTVVIARGDRIRSDPEGVRNMIRACRDGWRAYLNDPRAANADMAMSNRDMDAKTFKLGAEAQKPLIETDETRRLGLGAMTAARWDQLAQQLLSLKVIRSAPPADSCFLDGDKWK